MLEFDVSLSDKEKKIYSTIEESNKEFAQLKFYFDNYKCQIEGMDKSIILVQQQFQYLQNTFEQKIINVDNEIVIGFQREHENYQSLNDKQTRTDIVISEKFKKLESQSIKIDMANCLMDQYLKEITDIKLNLLHIEKVKADKDNLELFRVNVHELLRKMNVEHDKLYNKVVSLENFADKYVPLISQNITCDTLNQIVGHKERK